MLPGRNKVPGLIKQGGGPDSGLVFATCALEDPTGFLNLATCWNHLGMVKGTDLGSQPVSMEL